MNQPFLYILGHERPRILMNKQTFPMRYGSARDPQYCMKVHLLVLTSLVDTHRLLYQQSHISCKKHTNHQNFRAKSKGEGNFDPQQRAKVKGEVKNPLTSCRTMEERKAGLMFFTYSSSLLFSFFFSSWHASTAFPDTWVESVK